MLGGDVHQAYLEHVGFRSDRGVTSAVYQAVCSPFRNQLERKQRNFVGIVRRSRVVGWLAGALARSAGVDDPEVRTTPADHRPALEVSLRMQIA